MQSYSWLSLESCYRREERKKRAYEQRILDVEHGTFTPLMFSTSGSMRRLAQTFYARLAHLLSIKRHTINQLLIDESSNYVSYGFASRLQMAKIVSLWYDGCEFSKFIPSV